MRSGLVVAIRNGAYSSAERLRLAAVSTGALARGSGSGAGGAPLTASLAPGTDPVAGGAGSAVLALQGGGS